MERLSIFKKIVETCLLSVSICAVFPGCQKESLAIQYQDSTVYPTAASVYCSFNFVGGHHYNDAGVLFGTSSSSLVYGECSCSSASNPKQTEFILKGLESNTTYYYRAYVCEEGNNIHYGGIASFSTPTAIGVTANNLDVAELKVTATVYSDKPTNYTVSRIGIQYAAELNSIEQGQKVVADKTNSVVLTNLMPSTKYNYRAYAEVSYNGIGTDFVYGKTESFMTKALPVPTATVSTQSGTVITVTSPDATKYGITSCGVEYALSESTLSSGKGSQTSGVKQSSTSYLVTLTALASKTTYYYRPYYKINTTTVYGKVSSFVSPENPPFVLTGTSSYPWSKYSGSGYYNCLCSSNKGNHSTTSSSILTITVSKTSTLSFSYRVSSESKYDKLTITLDGTTVANAISGSTSSSKTLTIYAGSHTIALSYSKDGSGASGDDRGYIYNIALDGNYISNADIIQR